MQPKNPPIPSLERHPKRWTVEKEQKEPSPSDAIQICCSEASCLLYREGGEPRPLYASIERAEPFLHFRTEHASYLV